MVFLINMVNILINMVNTHKHGLSSMHLALDDSYDLYFASFPAEIFAHFCVGGLVALHNQNPRLTMSPTMLKKHYLLSFFL